MITTTKKSFVIKIDKEHCKGCELCVVNCPQKIFVLTENVNKLGYRYVEVIDETKCIGCGRCYIMCPDYLIEIFVKE